jgi:SlyX protein
MTDDFAVMRDRLVVLEERHAEQERVIEDLSAEIARQWTVIDGLTRRLEWLNGRLDEQGLDAPANTPPPHY